MSRLADDHENARLIARMLDGVGAASIVPPDTNILMIDITSNLRASAVVEQAARQGVRVAEWSPTRIRLVTHLDVSTADCRRAGEVLATILAGA
jgi:threonine aldolase